MPRTASLFSPPFPSFHQDAGAGVWNHGAALPPRRVENRVGPEVREFASSTDEVELSLRIQIVARMRRCGPAIGARAGQPRATNRSGRSARALLPTPRFVVGNCSAHARGLGSPFSQHAARAGAYARQGRLARIPDVPGTWISHSPAAQQHKTEPEGKLTACLP